MPERNSSSASSSCANPARNAGSSRPATARSSGYENSRPIAAPICAISLTGASRSRRAANESCNVAGMAKGGNGPSRCQPCGPATSRLDSSTALVNSSTKRGTPSVLATICVITSGGSGRPATRSTRISTSAGARRSSAMLVTCERPVQGASYSGRKVISTKTGNARTRSTVRSSTSSEVASAQWTSSNSINTGFCSANSSSCSSKAARVSRRCCAALHARRVALAGRDRQQGSEERNGFRNGRGRQYGFKLVELRLGRVLGGEAGGAPQLHDKGVQDAVAVIRRALIAQPRVRLVRDLGGELGAEPRLADAGLAREQDDLAGAGPGRAQAVAQQGALRRPPDEVGEPAVRRLEAALCCGDAFDREGFDRLGEALDRLAPEVAQPEQIADQASGGAGEDDLPGFRHSLQARRQVGGLTDHRLLLRQALADQVADDDKPGGDADAHGELLRSTSLQARHRRCYFEPGPHRALGVVLMRPRVAEISQHPVAHVFGDKPVIARDDASNGVLIGADLLAQFLGVEPRRQGRRADEVAKHHRQLPPLGGVVQCRTGRCGGRRRCLGGGQS